MVGPLAKPLSRGLPVFGEGTLFDAMGAGQLHHALLDEEHALFGGEPGVVEVAVADDEQRFLPIKRTLGHLQAGAGEAGKGAGEASFVRGHGHAVAATGRDKGRPLFNVGSAGRQNTVAKPCDDQRDGER